MSIKAILLDLDGTIVNTNELILQSFEHTLNLKLGYCPPRTELVKTFGQPLSEVFAEMAPDRADELLKEYQDFQKSLDFSKYITLCPGISEALPLLQSRGYKLAVVTSKRHQGAYQNLEQFALLPYFSAIVTFEDTEDHKPTGAPARKALEILNIVPNEAIMIGDSNYDILCGQDAGTLTAAVAYSAFNRDFLLSFKPDYYISDLMELVAILANESN